MASYEALRRIALGQRGPDDGPSLGLASEPAWMRKTISVPGRLTECDFVRVFMGHDCEFATDKLEHESCDTVGFGNAVDRRDVRMIQRGKQLCFAAKPRDAFGVVRDSRRLDFERHLAAGRGIERAIHLAHPACPE